LNPNLSLKLLAHSSGEFEWYLAFFSDRRGYDGKFLYPCLLLARGARLLFMS
jgi:hypothetical protein